jgi:hypothetical protein
VGLVFAVSGLAVVTSASVHPPMAGCPPLTTDPSAITLTPALTVDYCAGTEPVADAFDWFLLLNGVGVVTFLGGLVLVTYERLGQVHRALAG